MNSTSYDGPPHSSHAPQSSIVHTPGPDGCAMPLISSVSPQAPEGRPSSSTSTHTSCSAPHGLPTMPSVSPLVAAIVVLLASVVDASLVDAASLVSVVPGIDMLLVDVVDISAIVVASAVVPTSMTPVSRSDAHPRTTNDTTTSRMRITAAARGVGLAAQRRARSRDDVR